MEPICICNESSLNYVDPDGLWPARIHNEFIRAAFPGLSKRQLEILEKASADADSPLGTHVLRHEAHFTRDPPQEGKTHEKNPRHTWPSRSKRHGGYKSSKGDERVIINEAALRVFGFGLHTVMDSTSPAHLDEEGNPEVFLYGEFLTWFEHGRREARTRRNREDGLSTGCETIMSVRLDESADVRNWPNCRGWGKSRR